jgi:hypothetical protein
MLLDTMEMQQLWIYMGDWAWVLIGIVYNCYWCVMVVILQHHDDTIHFDPLEAKDQIEID